MMLAFAFLGFILENTFKLLTSGYIDNNHHFFPASFTYSIIIFLLYSVLGEPDDMRLFTFRPFDKLNENSVLLSNLSWCAVLAVAVFLGEIIVGSCNYYIAGAVIWDYNFIPLSVKLFGCPYAFTSLQTTAGFTAGGWLFMKFAFRPMMKLFEKVPVKVAVITGAVLGSLIIGDYIFTLAYTQVYSFAPAYWSVNFKASPPTVITNLKIFP